MRVPCSRLTIDILHVVSNGQNGLDISFLPAPSLASSLLLFISLSDYPLDTFTRLQLYHSSRYPPPPWTVPRLPTCSFSCLCLCLCTLLSPLLSPFKLPLILQTFNSIFTAPGKSSRTPTCGEVPWHSLSQNWLFPLKYCLCLCLCIH